MRHRVLRHEIDCQDKQRHLFWRFDWREDRDGSQVTCRDTFPAPFFADKPWDPSWSEYPATSLECPAELCELNLWPPADVLVQVLVLPINCTFRLLVNSIGLPHVVISKYCFCAAEMCLPLCSLWISTSWAKCIRRLTSSSSHTSSHKIQVSSGLCNREYSWTESNRP